MLDQSTRLETQCGAVDPDGEPMAYGVCRRCQTENSPHPCYGFVGTGTICQRNWCAHNYADHA